MSCDLLTRLNPEFVRTARVVAPRRRVLFTAALTAALLLAGGWLLWGSTEPALYYDHTLSATEVRAMHIRDFGQQAFFPLTVVLFGLLFVLAPAMNGLSFVQERLRGTSVFQQMTLLSPTRLAVGKFAGSGLFAYFIAAMLLPCVLFAAVIGHVHADAALRLYLFLFVGGLCWQAIGLLVSAALAATGERGGRAGLLVGPAVALGGAVTAVALQRHFTIYFADHEKYALYGRDYYTWHFYGAEVPSYLGIVVLLAFVGVWAFVGAVRAVKAWQLIPTGPLAAWLFLACAELLLVGLFWGRYPDDSPPASRLALYILINWVGLAALAGWSVLGRGRLREWWSVERDAVAVFRRGEIRNALVTFLLGLGLALGGVVALWSSYHVRPDGSAGTWGLAQLVGIVGCFGLTALGTAAFIQCAAMYRFRLGGWAGVGLIVIFYLFMGLAGTMLREEANGAALANPLVYVRTVTKGDYYMDSGFASMRYVKLGGRSVFMHVANPDYTKNQQPSYDVRAAILRGFLVEGVIALCLLGLTYIKWTRTRDEMLEEGPAAV